MPGTYLFQSGALVAGSTPPRFLSAGINALVIHDTVDNPWALGWFADAAKPEPGFEPMPAGPAPDWEMRFDGGAQYACTMLTRTDSPYYPLLFVAFGYRWDSVGDVLAGPVLVVRGTAGSPGATGFDGGTIPQVACAVTGSLTGPLSLRMQSGSVTLSNAAADVLATIPNSAIEAMFAGVEEGSAPVVYNRATMAPWAAVAAMGTPTSSDDCVWAGSVEGGSSDDYPEMGRKDALIDFYYDGVISTTGFWQALVNTIEEP